MNAEENFLALKLDTMKRIIELEDAAKLQRVLDVLLDVVPPPQHLLDFIDQRRKDAKTEVGTPLEEYQEEIKDL